MSTAVNKSTSTTSSLVKTNSSLTWNDATMTWDVASGTWDLPGIVVNSNLTKSTTTASSLTKS